MKVILTANVNGLGRVGDEKNVNEGHARNFLIPRGLAVPATAGAEKQAADKAAAVKRQRDAATAARRELAAKLKGAGVTLRRTSADGKKLFGSVNARDLAEALHAQGYAVDAKHVVIPEAIRTVGEHRAQANLGEGLTTPFTVTVVAET
ncbi:MAG TPA: 50S ribosomal protein L9 [bacterium]|nr:50S ribosomal protein L9 [bacterium]